MPYKNKQEQKEAQRKWYLKNKDKVNQRTKDQGSLYLDRNRKFIREIKENNPCKDCGKFYHWIIMDFDHLGNKKLRISYNGSSCL